RHFHHWLTCSSHGMHNLCSVRQLANGALVINQCAPLAIVSVVLGLPPRVARGEGMPRSKLWLAVASIVGLGLVAGPAMAQKSGGVLKFFHRDSPASMSILEEATISTVAPTMAVFNNLILFNQHEKQNRPEFIEPELAESWSWNADFTRLSFKLRQGVKWHDGKP